MRPRLRLPVSLFTCVIIAALPNILLAEDAVKSDGFKYTDNFTVIGIKDGRLQARIRDREKTFDLDKVDWINISNQPLFNQAEDNRKDPAKAAELYKAAIAKVSDAKLKLLFEIRAVGPLEMSGNYTAASDLFLEVYREFPAESLWRLRPNQAPADVKLRLEVADGIAMELRAGKYGADAANNLRKWEAELRSEKKADSISNNSLPMGQPTLRDLGTPKPKASVPFGGPGDLFPHVAPVTFSKNATPTIDVQAPLSSASEEERFHSTYDEILRDARKGSAADRINAAELLDRRASAPGISDGTKQLLALAAFDLIKGSDVSPAELAKRAKIAVSTLEGPTLALTEKRLSIRLEVNRIAPQAAGFAAADIADEYFAETELHFRANQFAAAAMDLQSGAQWAEKNPAYAAKMKPSIDRFSRALRRLTVVEEQLKASPNDPDANTEKGLGILSRPGDAVEAAPYLCKSQKPELQKLGQALIRVNGSAALRLELAAAAAEAMAVTTDEAQLAMAYILQSQAELVESDRSASEAQKAKAELLVIKAENLIGKAKLAQGAEPPSEMHLTKFFGLETQGRRIIFIFDHSGSMLDTFDFLRKEAAVSIANLDEEKWFNVIMVSETASPVFPKMQQATAANKREFANKMQSFRAQGMNDDLLAPFEGAFKDAFSMNPDSIYFLTDGHFSKRLSDSVKKMRGGRAIRINTIAFVNHDPSYETQLQDLAKDNNGSYKFVGEKDLNTKKQ